MSTFVLHDWSVICVSARNTAPKHMAFALNGYIYGNDLVRYKPGTRVSTSLIPAVRSDNCRSFKEGDRLTSESETVYLLGEPSDAPFLSSKDWCARFDQMPRIDPKLNLRSEQNMQILAGV